MKQKLGIYDNLSVEWVPGMTPTAVFYGKDGKELKKVELADKTLDEVLEILRENGFEPDMIKENFPENPTGSDSFGGHHYEVYDVQSFYQSAKEFAESKKHNGESGYLATVTSKEEDSFVTTLLNKLGLKKAWLGAQDADEGKWKWTGGPEKDTFFWSIDADAPDGSYSNWKIGEPNDADDEDCAIITVSDGWNDIVCRTERMPVVVEYGSAPIDMSLNRAEL